MVECVWENEIALCNKVDGNEWVNYYLFGSHYLLFILHDWNAELLNNNVGSFDKIREPQLEVVSWKIWFFTQKVSAE